MVREVATLRQMALPSPTNRKLERKGATKKDANIYSWLGTDGREE